MNLLAAFEEISLFYCETYQDHGIGDLFSQNRIPGDSSVTLELVLAILGPILLDLKIGQAGIKIGFEMGDDIIHREQKWLFCITLFGLFVAALTHVGQFSKWGVW